MPLPPAPFPRLVEDNASSSLPSKLTSSSLAPRSLAKRIKTRCQSPGILLSRVPQFDTLVTPISKRSASFVGPPKCEIISDADRIVLLSTLRGRNQALNTHIVDTCGNRVGDTGAGHDNHASMSYLPPPVYNGKKAFERVARLLKDKKGINVMVHGTRDGSNKAAAAVLKVNETTFNNWKRRKSGLPAEEAPRCAFYLDVDPNFIMGLTDQQGDYDPNRAKRDTDVVADRLDRLERNQSEIMQRMNQNPQELEASRRRRKTRTSG